MRLILAIALAIAACGGEREHATTTPYAKPRAVELGEMTLWNGKDAELKIHADGTTELGYPPLALKVGPTIAADGTVAIEGEARARINADGTITDLRGNTVFPIAVTADKVTITDGSRQFGIDLARDGRATVFGGNYQSANPLRIEGADTAAKRRTILAVISLNFFRKQPGEPAAID